MSDQVSAGVSRNGGSASPEDVERVVRGLRGVVAARAIPLAEGGIDAVHVLGEAERSPKLIAIDVVAAVSAELGLTLDPRQVRVASLRLEDQAAPLPQSRLKYVGLSVSVIRGGAEIKVQLDAQGELHEGTAAGPAVPKHMLHLVAEATVRAMEYYLHARGMLLLGGVSVARVGEDEVAVVTVTLAGEGRDTLAGASVVRDDPREAVVRATLAAVNRPISWLKGLR
jgi:hypothetical protein